MGFTAKLPQHLRHLVPVVGAVVDQVSDKCQQVALDLGQLERAG